MNDDERMLCIAVALTVFFSLVASLLLNWP